VLKRTRLDERLVAEGFAASRTRAQALIREGRILVNEVPIDKPGTQISVDAVLRVRGVDSPFASRGGEELAGALDDLGIDPTGWICLDIGASTGGFTDCLLQRGAMAVTAVDVGYGQLHEKLRRDPRVTVLERTNARKLAPEHVQDGTRLVTMDVSFISATLLLPRLAALLPEAEWLIMVKPQFEVGKGRVGKGGVVRDEDLRTSAVERVCRCAEDLGYEVAGRVDSRIPGPKGNREVFVYFRPRVISG